MNKLPLILILLLILTTPQVLAESEIKTSPDESKWMIPQHEWGKIVENIDMGDGGGNFKESSFKTRQKNFGHTIIVSKNQINTDDKLLSILEEELYIDLDNQLITETYETLDKLEYILIITVYGDSIVGIVKDCGLLPDQTLCTITVMAFAIPGVPSKVAKETFAPAIKYLGKDFNKILNRVEPIDMYNLVKKSTAKGNLHKSLDVVKNVPEQYQKDVVEHLSKKDYDEKELDILTNYLDKNGADVLKSSKGKDQLLEVYDSKILKDYNLDGIYIKKGYQNPSNDNDGSGIEHIIHRHRNLNNPNRGTQWPESFSEKEILENIKLALKNGKIGNSNNDKNLVVEYNTIIDATTKPVTKNIRVVIDKNSGEIITALPLKGKRK